MRHGFLLGSVALLASGCAVFDPHIQTGPEQGYCYASAGIRSGASGGCPENHRRHHAWTGSRETGAHLDEALAFLRDRRRQMTERERELAQLGAVSRAGLAVAGLTAVGAAAFGAPRDLIISAGLGTGAAYVAGNGFAPQAMRDVYNAGAAALSCVETRALSARITPQNWERERRRKLALAVGELSRRVEQARRFQSTASEAQKAQLEIMLEQAEIALRSAQSVNGNLSGAPLSGPLIANALYDRTLAIVIQVNSEIDRATPGLDAIMELALNSTGTSLNGVADTVAALSQCASAARKAERGATGDAGSGDQSPSGGSPAPQNAAGAAAGTKTTSSVAPQTAQEASQLVAHASRRLAEALEALTAEVGSLSQDPLTQIRSCAFQQSVGRGLTISPSAAPLIARGNQSGTISVSGGRGPYRISRTGTGEAKLLIEPEYSPGQFTLRNTGAAAGSSATFLLTDQRGESAVVTLRVR